MKLYASIDGAARGNPGPAAVGVAITDAEGKPVAAVSEVLGRRTNNQAEYEALLAALRKLRELRPAQAVIRTDSQLLYSQMLGIYRVKDPRLAELKRQARELMHGLTVEFELIPREENRAADKLANRAFRGVAEEQMKEWARDPDAGLFD